MKKLFATLLLGSVLSVAALAVPAQQSSAVTITPGTGSAQVRLDLPDGTVQDVTTMRLSVTVASTDSLQASFVFDDGVQSSVREYRYDADSGRLNIYLSGRTELFTDGSLDLGEVRLATADGSAARATVSVSADCLEFRNAALGKPDQPDITPVSAEVTLEGKAEQPPVDLPDSQPDDNGSAGGAEETPNNTDTSTGGNHSAGNGTGSSTTHGGSNGVTVQTSVVEETTLVTATPAPAINAAGQGSTSSHNTSSGKGTAAPSATPAPEAADSSSRPADEENLSSVQDNAGNAQTRPDTGSTPETADDGETQPSPFGLVLGILALVVIAAGGGIVIFLRRRS